MWCGVPQTVNREKESSSFSLEKMEEYHQENRKQVVLMLDLLKPLFRKTFRKILIDADSFVCIVESIFYLCLTTKIGFTRIKLDSAT